MGQLFVGINLSGFFEALEELSCFFKIGRPMTNAEMLLGVLLRNIGTLSEIDLLLKVRLLELLIWLICVSKSLATVRVARV